MGHADPHNIGWGATFYNEKMEVYLLGFLDPSSDPDLGVDVQTRSIALQMKESTLATPEFKAFAVKVLGRLYGSTLAHEIIHSFGVLHNDPKIQFDLMNRGIDRNFTDRCGFEDNAMVNPLDPANFTDHGLQRLAKLQAANQAKIDLVFPVMPS